VTDTSCDTAVYIDNLQLRVVCAKQGGPPGCEELCGINEQVGIDNCHVSESCNNGLALIQQWEWKYN